MAPKAGRVLKRGAKTASIMGGASRGVTFDTGVLIALERRHADAMQTLCLHEPLPESPPFF